MHSFQFSLTHNSPLSGRIGRIVLRNALENKDIEVVAVNECVFLILYVLQCPD